MICGERPVATDDVKPLEAFTLISRPRWMWLIIAVLAVLAVLTYGFLGAIPRTVVGTGLTKKGFALYTVAAPQSGIIERMLVESGDRIEPGTPILSLTADVQAVQIESARRRLALLQQEDDRLTATAEEAAAETRRRLDSSIRQGEETIRSSSELLALRETLLTEQEKLLKQGFVAKETVLGTRTTVASLRSSIENARTGIAASRLESTQSGATLAEAKASRRDAIQQAEATLQQLEKQLESDFTVRSVVSGTVVEVSAIVGASVSAGQDLIVVEPDGQSEEIDVVVFLPQRKAKELGPNAVVQLSPSFADRSRYGFMKGTLLQIDEYAATDGELSRYIDASGMIADIQNEYQAVLVGRVRLEKDAKTQSGFAWSTRKGWPGQISPGTILDVQVIFEVDRPIELLLPWLRSLIGE